MVEKTQVGGPARLPKLEGLRNYGGQCAQGRPRRENSEKEKKKEQKLNAHCVGFPRLNPSTACQKLKVCLPGCLQCVPRSWNFRMHRPFGCLGFKSGSGVMCFRV